MIGAALLAAVLWGAGEPPAPPPPPPRPAPESGERPAPPAPPPPPPPPPPAPEPGDEELIRHLDEVENLELLQHLELFDPGEEKQEAAEKARTPKVPGR